MEMYVSVMQGGRREREEGGREERGEERRGENM